LSPSLGCTQQPHPAPEANPATGATVATVPVGPSPTGVAFDGTYLYVVNFEGTTGSKIRPSDNAILTSAYSKIGASGDYLGSYFITKLVGPAKAKQLYFFSDKLDAAEGLRIGLLDRVVPDAQLEQETHAFALRLATQPGFSYRYGANGRFDSPFNGGPTFMPFPFTRWQPAHPLAW